MIIITNPVKTRTGTIATVAEAKKQLNIEAEFTEDDNYIESLIDVAIESVEDDTNSDIMDVSNVLTYRIGDGGETGIQTIYTIPQSPFQSFTKLETSPDGATFTEVPATAYKVTSNNLFITVELLSTLCLCLCLRLSYKTGYPTANLPAKLKQAVILRTTDLFDNERQGYNLQGIAENVAYRRLISKHVRNYW